MAENKGKSNFFGKVFIRVPQSFLQTNILSHSHSYEKQANVTFEKVRDLIINFEITTYPSIHISRAGITSLTFL